MAKLKRPTQLALSEAASLRLRAAWLYFNHGLTQKDVADRLGLSRGTVIRLLDEATRRGEVRIWIAEGDAACLNLAAQLEDALGLDEAIIVPTAIGTDQTAKAVGSALGKFLSEAISDGMQIGVGWGRTLTAALASFRPPSHTGVSVMSLLGGAIETDAVNPVEFSWRMAAELNAACYLFPAPLLVDSAATRQALLQACGLERLDRLAAQLDLVVLSVGELGPESTSLSRQMISAQDAAELRALGAVGDVMCQFLNERGQSVDHPIHERVMAVDLDIVSQARHKVLAAGGEHRAQAILAAVRRLGCNTLVTDEGAAQAMLGLAGAKSVDQD
jgi:DNA-binding transcriptional regulator LsrR (DeoR family)